MTVIPLHTGLEQSQTLQGLQDAQAQLERLVAYWTEQDLPELHNAVQALEQLRARLVLMWWEQGLLRFTQ